MVVGPRAVPLVKHKHPPGIIGVSVGEVVRYVGFVMSLNRVWRPQGSHLSLGQSVSIPENMNTICRALLDDPKKQWLWIQADDHLWERDALRQLLDLELDVVVPLIIRRGPPFIPVINKSKTKAGWMPFAYDEIPTDRPFEVHTAGTGGMLVRRHVLEAIVERQGHQRIFEVEKGDKLAEDYVFCRKVRQAGFTIHCEPRVTMGHQALFAIWPVAENGGWKLRFDLGTNTNGRVSHFFVSTDQQQQEA